MFRSRKSEDKKLTNGKIGSLNPYLDEKRLYCHEKEIHPTLLPMKGKITTAIINWFPQKT